MWPARALGPCLLCPSCPSLHAPADSHPFPPNRPRSPPASISTCTPPRAQTEAPFLPPGASVQPHVTCPSWSWHQDRGFCLLFTHTSPFPPEKFVPLTSDRPPELRGGAASDPRVSVRPRSSGALGGTGRGFQAAGGQRRPFAAFRVWETVTNAEKRFRSSQTSRPPGGSAPGVLAAA